MTPAGRRTRGLPFGADYRRSRRRFACVFPADRHAAARLGRAPDATVEVPSDFGVAGCRTGPGPVRTGRP
jgi:hypothetical protein